MNVKSRIARILAFVVLINNNQLINVAAEVMMPVVEDRSIDAVGNSITSGKYTYTINEDNASITITKYIGAEENVIIPEVLDGYVVTGLYGAPFVNNQYVKNIKVPKTVNYTGTDGCIAGGASNLQNIFVDKENPIYYDIDGILYKNVTAGVYLCEFPEGKVMDTFKIPDNVTIIGVGAFYKQTLSLSRIIIPSTVRYITLNSFMYSNLEIYFHENINLDVSTIAFNGMLSGTKIIVTSSAMKEKLLNAISPANASNIEVINLSELDITTRATYTTASQSLLFTDGLDVKSTTVQPDTTYTLYDIYTQLPADTTESVTWTVSDSELATVDNARQTIKINKLSGDFDLIGKDESGHQIVAHMKIYIPYTSCTLPGTATVSPGEEGSFYAEFDPITAYAAAQVTYVSSNPDVIEITSTPLVKCGNNKEGKRIECHYKAKSLGTATITATINDNGNIVTKTRDFVIDSDNYLPTHFTLTDYFMNQNYVTADNYIATYTGSEIKPNPSIENTTYFYALRENADYTVSYTNNINVGTATITVTGTGDYYGTIAKEFTITPKPISDCTVSSIGTMTFTGKALEPVVTVKNGSMTLVKNDDYIIEYRNNESAGMGIVIIEGKGNYKGRVTKNFTITKPRATQKLSGTASYNKKSGDKPFTLNTKTNGNGQLTYKSSNTKVAKVNSKGKVTITGTGCAMITVTAKQTDSYEKTTKDIKVYVVPKKATITSLKSNKKAQMTVKWKKDSEASGYQVQYSTSSKFTARKTSSTSINKSSIVSKTVKSLKKGTKYYVRVRAYRTVQVNGKNVRKYGAWSKSKAVTP